jgi:hypothetical protein
MADKDPGQDRPQTKFRTTLDARTRELLLVPGARELLAAYAAAPRTIQQSILMLVVELAIEDDIQRDGAVAPFRPRSNTSPPKC